MENNENNANNNPEDNTSKEISKPGKFSSFMSNWKEKRANRINNASTHSSGKNWYDRNYKWIFLIPVIFFVIVIIYLVSFYAQNGDLIYKDVSLTGGTTITIFDGNVSSEELKSSLSEKFPGVETRIISDLRTGEQQGVIVETQESPEMVKPEIEKYLGYSLNNENSSIEFTGASISTGFYQQLKIAIIISFILMAIVVFIIFRTPVRSLSIIFAGLADILMTVFVLDILHIELSTAGIVALLMLIGYSVDVDILLTTRVVKNKEGTINERIWGAFKTGITMTLTAIAAIGAAFLLTHTYSHVLSQMFTIILIGLGFDIINCWVTNASILKWYAEKKHL